MNKFINSNNNVVRPINQGKKTSVQNLNLNSTNSFNKVLEKTRELRFSKHATQRLDSRNINLSDVELKRLTNGVDLAKSKGVKEAVIMMDNKVFVASIRNRTVITASTGEQLKENVFTNIDGAVIV